MEQWFSHLAFLFVGITLGANLTWMVIRPTRRFTDAVIENEKRDDEQQRQINELGRAVDGMLRQSGVKRVTVKRIKKIKN